MAECFKGLGLPFVVVANKSDKLKKSQIEPAIQLIADTLDISRDIIVPFSAEKGEGREVVLEKIYLSLEG